MQTQTSASTRVLEVSHFRRPSPCGLRPECNAITVAVKSPEDKKRPPKNITRTSISDGEQDKMRGSKDAMALSQNGGLGQKGSALRTEEERRGKSVA